MAFTLNRRLAQLIDSSGQLNTGKIPNDYITSDHVADNSITTAMLHTGFTLPTSSLTSIDTDNVTEGSSNLYFTNARARGAVSATGSLSYNSSTGVFSFTQGNSDTVSEGSTNLYFTTARVDSHLSGGTGVTYSSGAISIGQDVGTSATPTFGNITTTGYIAGPATFTIDPAAVGDNTGTVVIAGNLQVDGTTTTINSTTVNIDDLNIQLATGAANAAAANGAGITVDGASATITYDGTNDRWDFNKSIEIGSGYGGTPNTDSQLIINDSGNNYITIGSGASSEGGILFADSSDNDVGVISYNHSTDILGITAPNGIQFNDKLHIVASDPITNQTLIEFLNSSGYGIYARTNSVGARGNTLEFIASDYNNNSAQTHNVLALRPEGNVGIGVSSPSAKLHIQPANSDTLATAIFTRQNNAAGTDGNTFSLRNDAANNFVEMNSGGTNNGGYKFYTGNFSGDSVFTIVGAGANSGNVGIGTDNIGTNSKLDVFGGAVQIINDAASFEGSTADASLHIKGAEPTQNRLTQMAPIGTSQRALNLIASTDSGDANQWWSWGVDTDDEFKILKGTDFSDSNIGIRINSSGMLLVNTTSSWGGETTPHIESRGDVAGDYTGLIVSNTNDAAGDSVSVNFGLARDGGLVFGNAGKITVGKEQDWTTTASTVDGFMSFSTMQNESLTERMHIDSSGNVGIGVTSILQGYKLEVAGNIVIPSGNFLANRSAGGSNWGLIRGNDSGTTILGDSQSLQVTAAGNVGIGTSNPGVELDVYGDGSGVSAGRPWGNDAYASSGYFGKQANAAAGGGWNAGSAFMKIEDSLTAGVRKGTNIDFVTHNYGVGNQTTMSLVAEGYVGIGTSSPQSSLQIEGGRMGIISTSSSWEQLRVANSSVAEAGIAIMNGCTASEFLADNSPSFSNAFTLAINPYGCGTDTLGIAHGNLTDSIWHIDGSGNFGYGPGTDNPVSYYEISKTRPNVNQPSDYELKMTLNTYGYVGSGYKLALLQWLGGDTAGANDNFYAGIGSTALDGVNNSEEGSLDFLVRNGISSTNHLAMRIIGKAGTGVAGGGQHGKSVLFPYQGLAIDRVWNGYPGISVLNSSDAGSSLQGEFRFHGTNSASSTYPSTSGADFSVNVRTDGSFISTSDRRAKTNITTIDNALEKVNQLTGKRFQRINRENDPQEQLSKNGYKFGFIAQEVEDIIPEAVIYHEDEDDGTEGWNSAYAMDNSSVVALLVNAIKEQDVVIQDLKSRIETLEG